MKKYLSLFLFSLLLLLSGIYLAQNSYSAGPCDATVTNQIACENTKPGNPESEWDFGKTGASLAIMGYADKFSSNKGEKVVFKVKTDATAYKIDIYRIGYYQGNGARKMASVPVTATLPQQQPECITDDPSRLVDCGNWAESANWTIPTDAVSGLYIAKLTRTDGTSGVNHIYFVVRDDSSHADLLFQFSDTTWQAYNIYGGTSLYGNQRRDDFTIGEIGWKVSYNRPFINRNEFNFTSTPFF